jgi:hypothetical protein
MQLIVQQINFEIDLKIFYIKKHYNNQRVKQQQQQWVLKILLCLGEFIIENFTKFFRLLEILKEQIPLNRK